MLVSTPFQEYVMAMDRVLRRLRTVTAALDAAGVRYAVIGGNAVATWVAERNPAATRTTKDVDLLVEYDDVERVVAAVDSLGFRRDDDRRSVILLDPEDPDRKSGVHLVWAGRRVRPSSLHPAPSLDEAVRSREGYLVLSLPALLRMKLTAFRDIDRVHIRDMLGVGLIDAAVEATLPADLLARQREIQATIDPDDDL